MIIFFALLILLLPVAAHAEPSAKVVEEKTRYGEISYPVLSGLADKNIEQSINTAIKEEANTWNCDFDGERKDVSGLDYNAWSEVKLINENVLSYTVGQDYFCGGAHPNQQIDTYNYDLSTGSSITIHHLLTDELSGEKLTAFLLKDHKFDDESCKDAYTEINWDFYLREKETVFLPRLSGNGPCWEEFSITNEKLQPYFPTGDEFEEDRN